MRRHGVIRFSETVCWVRGLLSCGVLLSSPMTVSAAACRSSDTATASGRPLTRRAFTGYVSVCNESCFNGKGELRGRGFSKRAFGTRR